MISFHLIYQNRIRIDPFGTTYTYRLSSSYMERVKIASVIGIVLLEMVTQKLHFFIWYKRWMKVSSQKSIKNVE
jgi:uncharacterized membrane protein